MQHQNLAKVYTKIFTWILKITYSGLWDYFLSYILIIMIFLTIFLHLFNQLSSPTPTMCTFEKRFIDNFNWWPECRVVFIVCYLNRLGKKIKYWYKNNSAVTCGFFEASSQYWRRMMASKCKGIIYLWTMSWHNFSFRYCCCICQRLNPVKGGSG